MARAAAKGHGGGDPTHLSACGGREGNSRSCGVRVDIAAVKGFAELTHGRAIQGCAGAPLIVETLADTVQVGFGGGAGEALECHELDLT